MQEDDIHIWHIHAGKHRPEFTQCLNREELSRSRQFHSSQHAGDWRYFHSALRNILARYAHCEASELRFTTIARDKPILPEHPQIHFNLSHAADRALLAVTHRAAVGVDIERCRMLSDRAALVKRFFSSVEQERLAALPESEQDAAFFRIWTRKEAVIKAHGAGLGIPLDAFDVSCTPAEHWEVSCIRGAFPAERYFQIQDIPVFDGFAGAVALQLEQDMPDSDVRLLQFDFAVESAANGG